MPRHHRSGNQENALEVGVHEQIPILFGLFVHRAKHAHARIVDQYRDRSELASVDSTSAATSAAAAHVGDQRVNRGAAGPQFIGRRLQE